MEAEEGVVLDARLPKVLARAIAAHVEADQTLHAVVLKTNAILRYQYWMIEAAEKVNLNIVTCKKLYQWNYMMLHKLPLPCEVV